MGAVSFEDGSLSVTAGDMLVVIVLDDDELDTILVSKGEEFWFLEDAAAVAEVKAVPAELDGSSNGTIYHFVAPIQAAVGLEPVELEVSFDVGFVGGGSSTIDVVGNHALIRGVLGTSTYVQLRDTIRDHPEVDTLVMVNVEGSENDEINVHSARLIREAGWTTWVPANGDISSGGVDMFVAGVRRVIEPSGWVGVHSWGTPDGDVTAIDLPADHPAHRSQLEYFSVMLGDEAGPRFYWYTLEAAPFDAIHRMGDEEIASYGLVTETAVEPLPASLVGRSSAYIDLPDSAFIKATVQSCEVDGQTVDADLVSPDLGVLSVTIDGDAGALTLVEFAPGQSQNISMASISGSTVAGLLDLELSELGLEFAGASLLMYCR